MRLTLICLFAALCGCRSVEKAGTVSIFDGKTLNGWHRHKKMSGGEWKIADGMIVGKQDKDMEGGFLATSKQYTDFIVELDVRMEWPFDSGVFLRTGENGKSHQVTLDYRPGGEIGAVYLPFGKGFVAHAPKEFICGDTPDTIPKFRQGEWNHVRIRIEGQPPHIQFWLNGELVTDFMHTQETAGGIPPSGAICLQVHGSMQEAKRRKVYFKNIKVKEL